jgi:hypothetical protein
MVTSNLIKQKRISAGIRTITDDEIKEIQSFYDSGKSLRDCQKIYGYCRGTLLKYIKTRPIGLNKLSDDERKNRRVKGVVSWRVRTKQKLVEYKGGKCLICGYQKYFGNLTFHHRDPSKKDFQISGQSISYEKLKCEVDKCELLCHNCHGEVHVGLITI